MKFKEQLCTELFYEDEKIGDYFIDFVIEDKIVLEIKVGNKFFLKDIKQIQGYLKSTKLKLGILVLFSKNGVEYKRIVNYHLR